MHDHTTGRRETNKRVLYLAAQNAQGLSVLLELEPIDIVISAVTAW